MIIGLLQRSSTSSISVALLPTESGIARVAVAGRPAAAACCTSSGREAGQDHLRSGNLAARPDVVHDDDPARYRSFQHQGHFFVLIKRVNMPHEGHALLVWLFVFKVFQISRIVLPSPHTLSAQKFAVRHRSPQATCLS